MVTSDTQNTLEGKIGRLTTLMSKLSTDTMWMRSQR